MPDSRLLSPLGTYIGLIVVLGKTYLTKQASLLLEFARNTSDSDLSAKLVSKAADLKSQADPLPDMDHSPKAPDVAVDASPDEPTGAD
ncbi:hypothetical protein QA641_22215 [Bradyrhizobium sp. CB1650]|uniref:hypothetical protein n=1 Tax=Bradyrhizobium sp. CB1650 TaxID=3039153 RepID=UPI002434A836|nr:hypothetical protein [Bradyrhizobium sp. CB1650]WGD56374.1 hypothetical protein QA641_22215 [Bradyrhizobium sp. CB1650]